MFNHPTTYNAKEIDCEIQHQEPILNMKDNCFKNHHLNNKYKYRKIVTSFIKHNDRIALKIQIHIHDLRIHVKH